MRVLSLFRRDFFFHSFSPARESARLVKASGESPIGLARLVKACFYGKIPTARLADASSQRVDLRSRVGNVCWRRKVGLARLVKASGESPIGLTRLGDAYSQRVDLRSRVGHCKSTTGGFFPRRVATFGMMKPIPPAPFPARKGGDECGCSPSRFGKGAGDRLRQKART